MTLQVSPDGVRLLQMGDGHPQPRPFHYRWLLPFLLGANPTRWIWAGRISMVAVGFLAVGYCHTWYALPVPLALSGLNLNLRLPILVDLPAMALALGAAVAMQHGLWPLAIVLSLLAGATKETSPVFAALWAWNPVLLVGLLAPAARMLVPAGEDTASAGGPIADALTHPWRSSQDAHAGQWLNSLLWLAPWGPLLIGASRPSWQVGAVLLVAYGQCAVATDSIRLYQWAWPVLLARTFEVTPSKWWLLVVVLAYANPFKGSGV